jgi:phosphotransferase system  glucose/maltose/N-acetylglucosamine-specific IIC component
MDMNYVFGVLLGVVGFFLRDFWASIKQLRTDVDSNKEKISLTDTKLEVLTKDHDLKHLHISEKFDNLSEVMKELTKEIKILSIEIIGGVFISGIIYYIYNKGKKLNKDINYLNDMLSLNPEDREAILKSSRRLESHRKGGTRKISRKKYTFKKV